MTFFTDHPNWSYCLQGFPLTSGGVLTVLISAIISVEESWMSQMPQEDLWVL